VLNIAIKCNGHIKKNVYKYIAVVYAKLVILSFIIAIPNELIFWYFHFEKPKPFVYSDDLYICIIIPAFETAVMIFIINILKIKINNINIICLFCGLAFGLLHYGVPHRVIPSIFYFYFFSKSYMAKYAHPL
jgi:hypothetical protein